MVRITPVVPAEHLLRLVVEPVARAGIGTEDRYRGDVPHRRNAGDKNLTAIPVVILTSSKAEEDIAKAYKLHANCYITKPLGLAQFIQIIKAIEDFWLSIVKLPPLDRS